MDCVRHNSDYYYLENRRRPVGYLVVRRRRLLRRFHLVVVDLNVNYMEMNPNIIVLVLVQWLRQNNLGNLDH